MAVSGIFVTFGEVMLRLSPPGRALLLQVPRLDVWFGGAEANVATQLARLGHATRFVSAVPVNALGDAAISQLRGAGIDVGQVQRREGRMGLYFAMLGAGPRPSEILYDRAQSSFAIAPASAWDWDVILAGADRLHVSGITAALGAEGAEAALAAARAANRLGVPLSFDGNYRARLWEAWDGDARAILTGLVGCADIMFGNHRDIALLLARPFGGEGPERRREAAEAAFAHFPRLALIASTARQTEDANRNRLSARIDTRQRQIQTDEIIISGIVDRIGTGDAFAAGILHALRSGFDLDEMARAGLALAALKHSIPGDASLFSQCDIDRFLEGVADIRR
ncbi:sugar kinase [Sphingomonas colocasiae]|uniref:Sugar kinase n=1 Tax=Sphingomonas colocasiae TaxID=1848973 RepID=A0ABS7PYE9_9SPHN|nr:sugar kinase [Sphingomonas colocasiae]MBY8826385.1 sugar kinase [Sphingomonas colocasiae]